MPVYTVDASVRLYGIEVEAASEDDAEEIVRDALYDWMDDTYVPLDPRESSARVDAIMGDDEGSYSAKPSRDSKGRFVSGRGKAPASRSGKGRAPAKACKGKGVRR